MSSNQPSSQSAQVAATLDHFVKWLDGYGETSWDHQSYFAGAFGGWAKGMYYRHPKLGQLAVAPMIFSEAFLPSARRLFHKRIRFPIADAHYAMGFAYLYEISGNKTHLDRAEHFLRELILSRAPAFKDYGWGYVFDWVTRTGILPAHTPIITTTPYAYEAFAQVHSLAPRGEWRDIMESIARHGSTDIKAYPTSEKASTSAYGPNDKGGVINASAYRAGMLTSAAKALGKDEYWKMAERNLYFVLENQNSDGSWNYSIDGVRDFIDHFHTCFVMKALAKVHTLTGHADCLTALKRGSEYYLNNLFYTDGMPKPFTKAPRLTVYKRELYDCAEAINLCVLLRDRIPGYQPALEKILNGILTDWIQPSGAFRARKLHLGWDNVPMHRWGQSQMFRSLAFFLRESRRTETKT